MAFRAIWIEVMAEFFDDIHSTYDYELGGLEERNGVSLTVKDSPAVMDARRNAKDTISYIQLGKALARQLRYREAIIAYTKAIELSSADISGCYDAHRLRGGRYLTTLSLEKADEDLAWCLQYLEKQEPLKGVDKGSSHLELKETAENGNSQNPDGGLDAKELSRRKTDVLYLLGLSTYYRGDYAKARKYFEEAIKHSDDEMGIAIIYWHTLSSARLALKPTLLSSCYNPSMKIGHHTAYDNVMKVWSGRMEAEKLLSLMEAEDSDLEYSMVMYGLANYCKWKGEEKKAKELLSKVLSRDGFWISFAFIGAWSDENRRVF